MAWRVSGNFTLAGIRQDDRGRLAATLGGHIDRATLDEIPIDPERLLSPVVAGTAVAVAGILAFFSFLFSRIASHNASEHPRRRELMRLIEAHPGLSSSQLAAACGIPKNPLRHHLRVLKANGLIVERRLSRVSRFFENHGRYSSTWQRIAFFHEVPGSHELYEWFVQHPESSMKLAAEWAEKELGWTVAWTYRLVPRMEAARLLAAKPWTPKRRVFYALPLNAASPTAASPGRQA